MSIDRHIASVPSAAELVRLHQRYPADTLYGGPGSLADGVVVALPGTGANSTPEGIFAVFHAGGRPYTISVSGHRESAGSWESRPGAFAYRRPATVLELEPVVIGGGAIPSPSDDIFDPWAVTANEPPRVSASKIGLTVAAGVLLLLLLGRTK